MATKLISITKPLIPEIEDANELIAYIARVSNPSNQFNTLTASKLLRFLIREKHWSPFEMVDFTVEISTTRDIGRQILRHRFKFQEFSQRYALAKIFEKREARFQDKKNRQNSIPLDRNNEEHRNLNEEFNMKQATLLNLVQEFYDWAITKNIAKEQARVFLPEGLTQTVMYVKGDLRNWIHYIQVRNHPATQKEHRDIAVEITEIIKQQFPSISDYIDEMIATNYAEGTGTLENGAK